MTSNRPPEQGPAFVQAKEDELRAKGFIKNRSGNWVPGRDDGLDLPLDQFAQTYNAANPGWQDDIYADFASSYGLGGDKRQALDFSLAYAQARQSLGMGHEDAVRVARVATEASPEKLASEVREENSWNRRMAVLPLSSPLNIPTPQQVEQQQQVVQELEQTPVPQSESRMRMAMRYGAPVLGALLGVYGLAALTGQPREEERERA